MAISQGSEIKSESALATLINTRIRTKIYNMAVEGSTTALSSYYKAKTAYIPKSSMLICGAISLSSRSYSSAISLGGGPTVTSRSSMASASTSTFAGASAVGTEISAADLINGIKGLMDSYAKVQKVTVTDSSGLQGSATAILNFTSEPSSKSSTLKSQIGSDSSRPEAGEFITPAMVNTFLDRCFAIWVQYCATSSNATYSYSYCHSNHCSHGNHGSRGRR